VQWLLGLAVLAGLGAFVLHFAVRPRHEALDALGPALRTIGATFVVFGIAGFGLVRLLLPEALRRYELLWILPTGACAVGLTMTVLGFAGAPYPASLPLVLVAGLALAAYAVRRRGWPSLELARLGWPVYLAFVVLTVALTPMVFIQHYAAPVGFGSDAHVATGVAQFLKHSYPTSVNLSQPINQMPPTWQSKYPIYYAFAAVSSISGLATWQVFATLAAVLLALAAVGMYLLAREVFGAPRAIALAAMALAALDREVLHTVLNPYFNQTWGFFALPFTLVLGWWAVQPGLSRRSRQAVIALLAMFALVLVLAYPLAAPIPAVPLLVFAWSDWRRRLKAGEDVFRFRSLYRGRRSLIWIVPVSVALAVPVAGAVDKAVAAAQVLAPGHSLADWGGDMLAFIPWNYFFSAPASWLGWVVFAGVVALAVRGLAGQPRALSWGLGGLLLLGLLMATYLRHRQYGYYFEFKLLAFIGPLALLIATVGAGRLHRRVLTWGAVAVLSGFVAGGAVGAIKDTGVQLDQATIELSSYSRSLPRDASVRLDMLPAQQLWAAYFLVAHPLCSQLPLLKTDYPHVPISRKADYIVASRNYGRPADAIGPLLRLNAGYALYRENPAVPGPSYCSPRMQDRIYSGAGHSPY
jgi:hypothetical protein